MQTTTSLRRSLSFYYRFDPDEQAERDTFTVYLQPDTLSLIPKRRDTFPPWTALSFHQCEDCPLRETEHPRCPVAANLVDVVEHFGEAISWSEATVEVTGPRRTYLKRVSLQEGLRSLLGIYMATSGCPILDPQRPMVRTHLPFADEEETLIRSLSSYLLGQLFRARRGAHADFDLQQWDAMYGRIRRVYRSFLARLRAASIEDAMVNAVGQLEVLAAICSTKSARASFLQRIEGYYAALLRE